MHNLDFFYGTNQVLFDVNLEVEEGEMVALLGTNGAGKSTLLRAVSGLSHPAPGRVRIFGMNSTYLEPEQIIDEGVALLVGGKMTFPGLTVRDNLRIGGHTLRRDRARAAAALAEAMDAFPELEARLDQPAGTLSGGEQQMLALARVMMTRPRLLLIDELALGLAPMTVDRLMAMVRRINEEGTTVILVEQSINRAAEPGRSLLLHGARRDPFRRPHGGVARARRPPPARLPRRRRGGPGLGATVDAGLSAPNFVLLQGVIIGLGYGLLAVGLVLIYRTNRVLNFAQGQVGVIAAVFLVKLTADFKFEYWFALVLSIALAAAVGALSELVLRRLFSRPRVLVMVATIGLSQVLLALTALPFIRPKNLYKPVPVPFDISFSLGSVIFTPARGAHPHRGPDRGHRPGRGRPLHQLGPLHARHVGERRLGPALRGVDPAHVDPDLDGGRRALRLHRHPQRTGPDQRPDPGPEPGPAAVRPDGRARRRHGQPDRGLRGRHRGGRALRAPAVERLSSTAQRQRRGSSTSLLLVVLLIRVRALRKGSRTGERVDLARAGGHSARATPTGCASGSRCRASWLALGVAVLLPLVLNVGNNFLFSQVCIYAVIALSLTILTGWAGQVSLGQFGLVAVGSLVAAHLGNSVPLPLLLLFGGAVTAAVAIVVGLPALRMPGLFLAVTTLGFAILHAGVGPAPRRAGRCPGSTRRCAPGCPIRPPP